MNKISWLTYWQTDFSTLITEVSAVLLPRPLYVAARPNTLVTITTFSESLILKETPVKLVAAIKADGSWTARRRNGSGLTVSLAQQLNETRTVTS